MQLASYGARAIPARLLPHNPRLTGTRAFHIATPSVLIAASGTAQKVVRQTRTQFSRFFAHLTAPGLRAPSTSFPTTARSLHTASRTGINGIHAKLSLPARFALSKGPFLPRAPLVPRSMTQVGLGTARNFSSARPIFQNMAQNVPIASRAFCEVDWDFHTPKKQDRVLGKEKSIIIPKTQERAKPNKTPLPSFTLPSEAQVPVIDSESELDRYFSAPRSTGVTSYLLIPLAPTPTSRLPLSAMGTSSTSRDRLLPIPALAEIHTTHSTHSLRVSSLFTRLDAGEIWDKGVTCDAYSTSTFNEGVCTILRVTFQGWTSAEVRSIIGQAGTGWCELQEVRAEEKYEESDCGMSDFSYDEVRLYNVEPAVDPAQSFVLPTLDFSSSFLGSPPPVETPALSKISSNASDMDRDRDLDFVSVSLPSSKSSSSSDVSSIFASLSGSGSWVQPDSVSYRGSSMFGFGFSSEFSGRCEEGPRAVMF